MGVADSIPEAGGVGRCPRRFAYLPKYSDSLEPFGYSSSGVQNPIDQPHTIERWRTSQRNLQRPLIFDLCFKRMNEGTGHAEIRIRGLALEDTEDTA